MIAIGRCDHCGQVRALDTPCPFCGRLLCARCAGHLNNLITWSSDGDMLEPGRVACAEVTPVGVGGEAA